MAIEVNRITKSFPREEKFVLTDQMRRASRSIPANIAEAWARRRYSKSFISSLVIAHGEEMEMEVWVDMSLDLGYIEKDIHESLLSRYTEISKMLTSMEKQPENFATKLLPTTYYTSLLLSNYYPFSILQTKNYLIFVL